MLNDKTSERAPTPPSSVVPSPTRQWRLYAPYELTRNPVCYALALISGSRSCTTCASRNSATVVAWRLGFALRSAKPQGWDEKVWDQLKSNILALQLTSRQRSTHQCAAPIARQKVMTFPFSPTSLRTDLLPRIPPSNSRRRRSLHLMYAATMKTPLGDHEIRDFVEADLFPKQDEARLDLWSGSDQAQIWGTGSTIE
jgi:hypothetical protein